MRASEEGEGQMHDEEYSTPKTKQTPQARIFEEGGKVAFRQGNGARQGRV